MKTNTSKKYIWRPCVIWLW